MKINLSFKNNMPDFFIIIRIMWFLDANFNKYIFGFTSKKSFFSNEKINNLRILHFLYQCRI